MTTHLHPDELKRLVIYDSKTGVFTRRIDRSDGYKTGEVLNSPDKNGYLRTTINDKTYKLHRLAWLYVYGVFPSGVIDHINGNVTDNRIENLRDTSHRQNTMNKKSHREGRLVGAQWSQVMQKWGSSIRLNGKGYHLGFFVTEKEASDAFHCALKKHETSGDLPQKVEKKYKTSTGVIGVTMRCKVTPRYYVKYHKRHVGIFNTLQEAVSALEKLKKENINAG